MVRPPPATEVQLTVCVMTKILGVCNSIQFLDHDNYMWSCDGSLPQSRRCDLYLEDSRVDHRNKDRIEIVGEVKRPTLVSLQDTQLRDVLNQCLGKQVSELTQWENTYMKPFVQLFWYMIESKRGLGILTTYDHSRFFKMDLRNRDIYMSGNVRVNQKLSSKW